MVIGAVVVAVVLIAVVVLPSLLRGGDAPARYVGRKSCIECHQQAYEDWKGSDHDWAMRPATDDNVLGDFSGVEFTAFGVRSRFFKRDGKYYVHTDGPDGQMRDYPIAYTFGHEPLQQYLIELDRGRLQCLSIAWDSRPESEGGQRWYHLYAHETGIDHEDELHWTRPSQNWNTMCASCHSTDLQKNYDLATDTYHTTWFEMNVSCETCHGPGSKHIEWANASGLSAWFGYDHENMGLIADLKTPENRLRPEPIDEQGNWKMTIHDTTHDVQLDSCAPCHSRRSQISESPHQGMDLLQTHVPQTLEQGLYFPDGQILDEVYVYGSFKQSLMYRQGVRCTDCHQPHSMELIAPGNALCTRCHQPERFDTPEHHFHAPNTPGASCVECHMPTRTYMGVDARRDHSLRIPRPDLSVKLGVPNACNQCHTDEDAKWAAKWVETWHGPQRKHDPHYGQIIAAGQSHESGAAEKLIELALDHEQPDIARATAIGLLPEYPSREAGEVLQKTLKDDESLVRVASVRALTMFDPRTILPLAEPMLDDPVLAVRAEAARVLSVVPADQMTPEQIEKRKAGLDEYRDTQAVNNDRPDAHLNLGGILANMGDHDGAIEEFKTAMRLNPLVPQPKWMLAQLYRQTGRDSEAEPLLRELVKSQPQFGDAYYSLGLLLAGSDRLEEAVNVLKQAADRMPNFPRVWYNYGLALQRLNRHEEAERALSRAYELNNQSPDFVNALSIFYVQRQQWEKALTFTQYLARLVPNEQAVRQRLQMIQSRMATLP